MLNMSVGAVLSKLAPSRLCGNTRWFDQNYQPGKITLQVSVPIIKTLVAVSFEFLVVQHVLYSWL